MVEVSNDKGHNFGDIAIPDVHSSVVRGFNSSIRLTKVGKYEVRARLGGQILGMGTAEVYPTEAYADTSYVSHRPKDSLLLESGILRVFSALHSTSATYRSVLSPLFSS